MHGKVKIQEHAENQLRRAAWTKRAYFKLECWHFRQTVAMKDMTACHMFMRMYKIILKNVLVHETELQTIWLI